MKLNFINIFIGILSAVTLLAVLALVGILPGPAAKPLALPNEAAAGSVDAAAGAALALAAVQNQRELQHDNYAIYYTPEEYDNLYRSVTGSYSGIGIYIYPDAEGRIMVYGVMKGGPAYEAGILPGDIFLQMNDIDLLAMDYSEAADMLIANPEGTRLNLLLERTGQNQEENAEPQQIRITTTTAKIDIPTLDYKMLTDTVGMIKIDSFNMTTGEQFAEAFTELQEKGMQGLILDLRNNGGGEITAALKICDYFVPKAEPLMYMTDSSGIYCYSAEKANVDLPLVILQNAHSASASEILIGAVRDNETGITIGETSYGKGIVQDLKRLNSGAGLRFTSAKYSTSHKNDIHGLGIEPDIYFPMPQNTSPLLAYTMDAEQDPQLARALEVMWEQLGEVAENSGTAEKNSEADNAENNNQDNTENENVTNKQDENNNQISMS